MPSWFRAGGRETDDVCISESVLTSLVPNLVDGYYMQFCNYTPDLETGNTYILHKMVPIADSHCRRKAKRKVMAMVKDFPGGT